MKNKKQGNIPVTILVIGVFVVCSLALLSFYSSDISIKHSFVGIALIEKMNAQIEEYSFSGNLDNLDLKNIDNEWFFYLEEKIKKHWYSLKKEKTVFSVEYNLP